MQLGWNLKWRFFTTWTDFWLSYGRCNKIFDEIVALQQFV